MLSTHKSSCWIVVTTLTSIGTAHAHSSCSVLIVAHASGHPSHSLDVLSWHQNTTFRHRITQLQLDKTQARPNFVRAVLIHAESVVGAAPPTDRSPTSATPLCEPSRREQPPCPRSKASARGVHLFNLALQHPQLFTSSIWQVVACGAFARRAILVGTWRGSDGSGPAP